MTQSFSNFVGASPPQDNLLLARLVQEARQGGTRGRLAVNRLRRLPGGREALQAVIAPAPPPVAPAPPAVAPQAPAPPPSPSFFDQTLGRGIGAAGRGVLGVGRFVQPVTTPIFENLGKGFDLLGGTVSSLVDLAPGQLYAGQNQGRGFNETLQEVAVEKGYSSPRAGGVWDLAGQAQILAEANRRTDMPSTTWNALPGQGIPLPGGKRLDKIDLGVKGAIELLPELAIGIATGGTSTAGSLARRTAVSAANVAGADIAKLGAKGLIGAGKSVIPRTRKLSPEMQAVLKAQEARKTTAAARGAGGQRGFKVTDEVAGKAGAKDTNGNLLNEDVRFTVSNDGSTARAMVLLPDENGKVIGSIVDFETSPELRRQGFGEALVIDTMEELRRRGATSFEVYAEPIAWNKVTKSREQGFSPKLFGKLGFELTGRKNKFGDREMVLDLIKGPEEVVLPEGFNLQAEMAKANQRGLDDIIKNEPEVAREIGLLDPPPTTPATGTAAAVEPKQLSFQFIDDLEIDPVTGKPSAVDEAFEVNQTKAVELPAGYAPGLVEDLIPKIVSPAVIRRAVEKSKAILKKVPTLERAAQLNPSTLPGMAVSATIKAAAPRISSTANRLGSDIRGKLVELDAGGNRVFGFDNADMRIENLPDVPTGINPRTGKLYEARPTVADLAQDYGAYRRLLNPKQQEVMDYLRVRAEALTADLEEFGFELKYRAELGDGGFFISRGPTAQEVQDFVKSDKRKPTRESFEKGRAVDPDTGKPLTQVEMLEGVVAKDPSKSIPPQEYLPVWDEMGQWSTEIYESILDKQLGKFVLNYVDPITGKPIALTTRELGGIDLVIEAEVIRAKLSAATRRLALQQVRLTAKQQEYVRSSKAFDTYTDKLSKLTAKLEEATTVAGVQKIVRQINNEAKKAVEKAERVSKTKQGKLQIAKMHSDDLQDQVESLAKFEEAQKQLLANAAQRLESQQLKGTNPAIINRSLKDVSEGEKFVKRSENERKRVEGLFATARKREDAADAAEGAAAVDAKLAGRDLADAEIPKNADAAFRKASTEFTKFRGQVNTRSREMKGAGKRAETARRRLAQSERKIVSLERQLGNLKSKIDENVKQQGKERTRATDTGYRSIDNNVWFDPADLETIRRTVQGMKPLSGKGSEILRVAGTYQSIRRAIGATLDDSAVSIQGKLTQFAHPREFAAAWKDHLQSLIGKPGRKGTKLQRESMADNIRKFDKESQAAGAPSSHEIIDRMGIRHGGVDTEVTLRPEGLTGTLGKAPLIRRANEAFGAFGDILRLRVARTEIMEYMRMSGKTFDELVADGTARKIGNSVNGLTGWTPNGVAGIFGDMLLFAPRFFRARIETLHRAIKGMDADFMIDALPFDRQIRRNLNIRGVRQGVDVDQLIARRAVMKLISTGTLITVAANEVLGQETDFQLMRNGRMNPNFMSVRLTKLGAPRDWNIFGPYKSMAALLLASGGAGWEKEPQKALDAWLNLSSPIAGDIFEFLNFKQYGESRFGETLPEYIAESHIPFALQEVPNIIKETTTGNPKDAFGGGLSIGLEILGEQSQPLSRSDILQDRVTGLFKEGKISADNYEDLEPYEKNDVKDALVAELEKFDAETAAAGKPFKRFFATIDIINRRRDSQLQEALVFYNAGRRSDGSEYTKREFTDDYFDILDDARERKDQVKETLGVEFEDKIPADDDLEAQALKAWHEAPSKSLTPSGSYLPDKLNGLRNKVLADYPDQVDYIYRNTNDTPLPAGFLEALDRAGLQSTVEKIMRSQASREVLGAPPQPIVPSSTLIPPEQPAMGGGSITPMPPPLGSNPALKGLLKVAQ